MIDTHCHLDSERFDADRAEVLERAFAAGVTGLVVPAVGPSGWDALLEWPAREPRVQVGLGIHPQLLPELPPEEDDAHLERLDALLALGVAVAVGECGVDGGTAAAGPQGSLERQVRVLKAHLGLARKHGLPVLVHCHRAHPTLRQVFEEERLPEAGVVLHSYSGGPELVKVYARWGCRFSFAGPVSWPEAKKPVAALEQTPPHLLLLETDAPDQSPHPHRGKRCEPAYLPETLNAVARALGRAPAEVAALTVANTRAVFPGKF